MGPGGGWGTKQANPEFSYGHSPRWGGAALPAFGREDSMMETSQRSTGKMTKAMMLLPPMEHPQGAGCCADFPLPPVLTGAL